MAIAKIQKGDKVKITSGKYKGTVGQVTKIVKKEKAGKEVLRAVVSGVEGLTKYQRGAKFANMPGGIFTVDRPIDISNLSLLTKDGLLSKVKVETKDGKNVRILKKTGEVVAKQEVLDEKKESAKKSDEKSKKSTKKSSTKKKEEK